MSLTPRVLILNYEYPPLGGGAANALYYLLEELASAGGVEVDLVTSSASGQEEVSLVSDSIRVHKLAIKKASLHYWTQREILGYCLKATPYINKLMSKNHYDICHAFFALPCGAMAYRLRKKMPYMVSLRGSDVPGFNQRLDWMTGFMRPVFKRVLRDASGIQANSEGLRQLAYETSAGADIEIIHNGVDCRQFSPDDARVRGSEYRIICVSRLIGRKGIDDLITALPNIKSEIGSVKLTIVGDGNMKESLQALAESKGVASDITWLGYVDHDDLPGLYGAADLFVLPSYFEGMSNALLEAMASGLPVVVTNTGGTDELVDGNGLVIEAGDQDGLARAVIEILTDEKKRQVFSKRSRENAIKFSWENVARTYMDAYKKVINVNK